MTGEFGAVTRICERGLLLPVKGGRHLDGTRSDSAGDGTTPTSRSQRARGDWLDSPLPF